MDSSASTPAEKAAYDDGGELLAAVRKGMSRQLIGLDSLVDRLLIALITNGHLLIEGPPGVAKTRAINSFAKLLNVGFARIQSTPDLLPTDITGSDIFQQQSGEFKFLPGPLFNNIVLVDEINRAPPKVQSALLEAMGEHQITTSGITRELQQPFMVAATQNPIEHEGTYPLPEAQLDRFMFFTQLHLPDINDERLILDQVLQEQSNVSNTHISHPIEPVANLQSILSARTHIQQIHISEAVKDYIIRLVGATRGLGGGAPAAGIIAHPASPRASINLALGAKALAALRGREFASPDDVAELAPDILCGRIVLDYRARADGMSTRDVIQGILENTARV